MFRRNQKDIKEIKKNESRNDWFHELPSEAYFRLTNIKKINRR